MDHDRLALLLQVTMCGWEMLVETPTLESINTSHLMGKIFGIFRGIKSVG
jgi:hypothetical protein